MPNSNQESRKQLQNKPVSNGAAARDTVHSSVSVQSNPEVHSDPCLSNDHQGSNNLKRLSDFVSTATHQAQTNSYD